MPFSYYGTFGCFQKKFFFNDKEEIPMTEMVHIWLKVAVLTEGDWQTLEMLHSLNTFLKQLKWWFL